MIFHCGKNLYDSIIGATVIAVGFYTVMWGKAKEDFGEVGVDAGDLESSDAHKYPLLQSCKTEVN